MQYPNWFNVTGLANFERFLTPLAGKRGLRFLQIGAFTGDASVWLLDNILNGPESTLVDVDTWEGSKELSHEQFDWCDVERVYDERTARFTRAGRLFKYIGSSAAFFVEDDLPHPYRGDEGYDFIYIDGAHDAYMCLNDGISAYKVLKVGGLLAFDDYQWHSGKGLLYDPQPAIDAIGFIYGDRLEPIEIGAQAWFRRVA